MFHLRIAQELLTNSHSCDLTQGKQLHKVQRDHRTAVSTQHITWPTENSVGWAHPWAHHVGSALSLLCPSLQAASELAPLSGNRKLKSWQMTELFDPDLVRAQSGACRSWDVQGSNCSFWGEAGRQVYVYLLSGDQWSNHESSVWFLTTTLGSILPPLSTNPATSPLLQLLPAEDWPRQPLRSHRQDTIHFTWQDS